MITVEGVDHVNLHSDTLTFSKRLFMSLFTYSILNRGDLQAVYRHVISGPTCSLPRTVFSDCA